MRLIDLNAGLLTRLPMAPDGGRPLGEADGPSRRIVDQKVAEQASKGLVVTKHDVSLWRITSPPPPQTGTAVQHQTMGVGRVLGEWGPVAVDLGKATRVSYPCPGIYDVEFPNRGIHCCRVEYLQRIAIAPLPGKVFGLKPFAPGMARTCNPIIRSESKR